MGDLMKNLIEKEQEYIKQKLYELGYEDDVILNISSRPEFGDYQYNGIMSIAKKNNLNPHDLSTQLVDLIKKEEHYKDINVAGPGFINITFKDEQLIDYLNDLNSDINLNYHNENPTTIFFDYGGANVAKALHVGHLRSANIGEALKRLAESLGNKTYSDTHLGDWGRPIGLVMTEIKKRQPDLPYFNKDYVGKYPSNPPITNDDLMEMYPLASSKAKEDEEYMEEARQITADFQKGDPGLVALWQQIMNVSKPEIKKIYDRLNATFDIWEGESDGYKYLPELIEVLEQEKLLIESQEAKVVEVKEENDDHEMPPLIIIKSNGSASYESTDLACILERKKLWNPNEYWYIVDSRQKLHFDQVFRAAKKAHIVDENTKLEFIPFGTMNGSDGKPFKTRDGGVMKLEDLLNMAYEECEKKVLPNIVGEERKQIAEQVAVAAVKYADLIPHRLTDYNFDPVRFSDLQGKTGPYLLYSTIRMKSLLKKAKESNISYEKVKKINNEYDRNIAIELLKIRTTIIKSYESKSLNDITDYLYKLTNTYNNFYSQNRILLENNEILRESWLTLTKIVYENNIKLLDVLGITVPEKM